MTGEGISQHMRTVTTTVMAMINAILFIGYEANWAAGLCRRLFLVILIFLINESHPSMELSCHDRDFFRLGVLQRAIGPLPADGRRPD